jgi:hypothetical protein
MGSLLVIAFAFPIATSADFFYRLFREARLMSTFSQIIEQGSSPLLLDAVSII